MFNSKKGNTSNESPSITLDRTHSILSKSATFIGEINSTDDLRIDGVIDGNISCEGKIIIGPEGTVNGNIKSSSIELMGKINGDVIVNNIVRLKAGSYFKGEITAVNIEIEAGANFFGNCKMADKDLSQTFSPTDVVE